MTPVVRRARAAGRGGAKSEPRPPRPPIGLTVAVLGAVLGVTTVAYLLFFGWHRLSELQGWAVWSYGVTFAVVLAGATWLQMGLIGGVAGTVSTTVLFCADAATSHGDGNRHWFAAVLVVLIAAATGTSVVGAVVHAERLAFDRRRKRPPTQDDRNGRVALR